MVELGFKHHQYDFEPSVLNEYIRKIPFSKQHEEKLQLEKNVWGLRPYMCEWPLPHRNAVPSFSAHTLYLLRDWAVRSKPDCAFKKINHDSHSIRKLCIHLLIATKVKMAESNKNPFCYLVQFVRLEKWDWISKPQASWLQSVATQLTGFFLLYLQLFW